MKREFLTQCPMRGVCVADAKFNGLLFGESRDISRIAKKSTMMFAEIYFEPKNVRKC